MAKKRGGCKTDRGINDPGNGDEECEEPHSHDDCPKFDEDKSKCGKRKGHDGAHKCKSCKKEF